MVMSSIKLSLKGYVAYKANVVKEEPKLYEVSISDLNTRGVLFKAITETLVTTFNVLEVKASHRRHTSGH